ncbi:sigma-70 region 2 family protein [Histoplasma ohiense]|nr:sigma-70 region 2 family protein [Histoplasma ohiense (nom. inval.)]
MSEPAKEPLRSTAPPAVRASNPPLRYKFIDASANNPESLASVKRHVMLEYARQKKWQQQQRLDTDVEDDADIDTSGETKTQRGKRHVTCARERTQVPSDRKGKKRLGPANTLSDGEGHHLVVDRDFQLAHRLPPSLDPGPGKYGEYQGLENADDTGLGLDADYYDNWGIPSSLGPFADPGPSGLPPFWYGPLGDEYQSEANYPGFQSNSGSSESCGLSTRSSSTYSSPRWLSPAPQTHLSAARTDPFDSLPISLDEEGKILFDFYANVMPSCSYGFHTRSPNAHNWYLQVFIPEAMKGDITFQNTILVHAANTQAWVKGLSETRAALTHRGRGIEMLRKHFEKHPADISDAAISATLSCAAVEDFDPRPERKPISWIHMRAAMQMIRARGGPAAFQQNQRMAMLINWQDYILAGYETKGPSFFYAHIPVYVQNQNPSDQTLSKGDQSFTPLDEIHTQCEEFLSFLHRCERLSLTQKSSHAVFNALIPSRYSAFQPDTLLFRILSSPPGIRYSIPGERKQIISRLAALITINVALWDYRNLPHKIETFLNGLQTKLLTSEVDVSSSVEALLQILLACDDSFGLVSDDSEPLGLPLRKSAMPAAAPVPSERPWFVGRMLKIAKRLGRSSWERLNDSLLSFLTLTAETPKLPSWETELRHEILTAPLTSYIMPLLQ